MKMEKKKTYVLDTTVLIYDPDIFYKLGDADIVVPLAAIKELDGLKKNESDLVAQSARQVSRMLDRISSYSDIKETGGQVSSGARIFIETSYEKVEGLASEGDQKITGTALYLKKKGVKNLILATTDTNMRIVGRTYGIKVEHYPHEAIDNNYKEIYMGKEIKTTYEKKSNRLLVILKAFNKTFLTRKLKLFVSFYVTLIIALYLAMPTKNIVLSAIVISFFFLFLFWIRNASRCRVSLLDIAAITAVTSNDKNTDSS
jgi:predicted ribonuclease YlaK